MTQETRVTLEDLGTKAADKVRREVRARVGMNFQVLIQVRQLNECLATVQLRTLVRTLSCAARVACRMQAPTCMRDASRVADGRRSGR